MATDGSDMTLYFGSGSAPCWRSMIAIYEKQLGGLKSNLIEFSKNEHKSPEVLAINPRGQVPTFRHGDIVVNESLAICFYVENVFKNQGTKLLPDNPKELGLVLQRAFDSDNLGNKVRAHFLPIRMKGIDNVDKEDQAKKLKEIATELAVWEDFVKSGYAAGANYSLADVLLFPWIAAAVRFGLPLDKFPNIQAYYNRVSSREAVQKAWPPHWKETPGLTHLKDI